MAACLPNASPQPVTPATTTSTPAPDPPTPSPTNTPLSQPPSPSPEPLAPVTANPDWTPAFETIDAVEMVQVPPGCYQMGSSGAVGETDERPAHRQCINVPFWLDRFEVTNVQVGSEGAFSGPDHPREEISWHDAHAHCLDRGGRLPTEIEWEYAARGPDNLVYPWGDAFNGHILNWCDVNCRIEWRDVRYDDGYGTTAPVGTYPENASWVGAYDLGGNVWEWTATAYDPYPLLSDLTEPDRARVIRGGAWDHLAFDARTANRARVAPTYRFHTIGFRCARDQ